MAESDRVERLIIALRDVVDAAERAMAGVPVGSEEWYSRRDYARIQMERADG